MRKKLKIEEPPENVNHEDLVKRIVKRITEWENLSETEPGDDGVYAG